MDYCCTVLRRVGTPLIIIKREARSVSRTCDVTSDVLLVVVDAWADKTSMCEADV